MHFTIQSYVLHLHTDKLFTAHKLAVDNILKSTGHSGIGHGHYTLYSVSVIRQIEIFS